MDTLSLGYRQMIGNQIIAYANLLNDGGHVASLLFALSREESQQDIHYLHQKIRGSSPWDTMVKTAENDLCRWEQQFGKAQRYTPTELALARVQRTASNAYRKQHLAEILAFDALHQAIISYTILSFGLAEKLKAERERKGKEEEKGKEKKGLAVVELAARLSPSLTFPGSSEYLRGVVIPYAPEVRTSLGEQQGKNHLVSEAAVRESAHNAQRLFQASHVLAETSTAPRDDIPKSGRKPGAYICQLVEGQEKISQYTIDTPFREEFNAQLRELMFRALKEMYA